MTKIGIVVGSLRKESFNKKIANNLLTMFPEDYDPEIIDIRPLEMYDQDLDDNGTPTIAWTQFREKIATMDGIVFVTPEYNRSIPAVIKNAIDVGSRPYGANVWDGKPALVISSSTGGIGGFGANHVLRQSLVFLNMPTLQQPEAYIGGIDKSLDENGNLIPTTKEFVQSMVDKYTAFLEQLNK